MSVRRASRCGPVGGSRRLGRSAGLRSRRRGARRRLRGRGRRCRGRLRRGGRGRRRGAEIGAPGSGNGRLAGLWCGPGGGRAGRAAGGVLGADDAGPSAGARRGRPRRGRCLLGRRGPPEALAISLAPDAVGLGVLDARGVALDPDPQRLAEVERLLVRQTELTSELVDTDLLRQLLVQSSLDSYCPRVLILPHPPVIPGLSRADRSCMPSVPLEAAASASRNRSTASRSTGARRALENPSRRWARSTQRIDSAHSHAPRPGRSRPMARSPAPVRTTRTRASGDAVRRQPTQVRRGAMREPPLRRPPCRRPPRPP